jgi:hypothetical protein
MIAAAGTGRVIAVGHRQARQAAKPVKSAAADHSGAVPQL